jgi:gliding motility-associated-like protein
MRVKTGLVFILSVLVFVCQAQKLNNVWAFGDQSGLNFNTDPVSVFKSKAEGQDPPYYISSICDKQGNLKFYTDGLKVWNKNNILLPIYNNWWPWKGTVMPLICPYPANDSLYYLFGIANESNANKLVYLTVKMINAGDVEEAVYPRPVDRTSYYKSLVNNASLLLAGTNHCNQKDVWIVTHTAEGLHSFLVTETGISSTPVVTTFSSAIIPQQKIDGNYSNIKFSANGEKLVFPLIDENKIVLFDFDKLTGKFSNPVKLSIPGGENLEDVELSVDGNKLYFGSYAFEDYGDGLGVDMHYLYQMDLNAGSIPQIEQSLFRLNSYGDRVACVRTCFIMKRTLQLGPDGKIYVSMRYTGGVPKLDLSLSVIEDPNKKMSDARYRKNFLNLGRIYKFINYNYIRSQNFTLQENGIVVQKKTCSDKPTDFSLLYNRLDSVKWDFGDPASGSNNYSVSFAPQHQYPGPGSYAVKAIIYNSCLADTATTAIVVQEDKAVRVPEFIKDTTVCVGNELALNVTVLLAKSYTWDNGLIYPNRTITEAGSYEITIRNDCSLDRKSFEVGFEECPCTVFLPTAFTPDNNGKNDLFRPIFKCFAKDYLLKIFNRYGEIIFETRETSKGWNGKNGNSELPTGVYVWILQYKDPNTYEIIQRKGTVVLIR